MQTLSNTSLPSLETLLNPQNIDAFFPLKQEFLDKSYEGIDLEVQHYCAIARKIAEAIYQLPLQSDCPVRAGEVMDSSSRILAHLKLVDYLEQQQLNKHAKAKLYIEWVQKAAQECFKILATGLAEHQPLSKIYVKNPIRKEIDEKGGSSKAVSITPFEDLQNLKQEIFKHPFKLVFFNQVDVRGYMPNESEELVKSKKESFFKSLSIYIINPETNVDLYPHSSKYGKIFSNFFENREFDQLKTELIKEALTKKVKDLRFTADAIEKIIEETLSPESQDLKRQTESKLIQDIQAVVDERKEIQLTPVETQIAHVQDHYPIELIVKEVLDPKEINELRNHIYMKTKGNYDAQAPAIRYPRISLFAKSREGYNLIGANYAIDYLEGKNVQLKQLAALLSVGIRRFVQHYKEQELQKQEDRDMHKVLVNLYRT